MPTSGSPPRFPTGRSGVAAIVGLAMAWEIVGRLDVSFFVPSFSQVVAVWWSLVRDGTLPGAIGSSLLSLVRGFVPAAILGVSLGMLTGTSRLARYTLDPILNTLMSAPLSALVPVLTDPCAPRGAARRLGRSGSHPLEMR